MVYRCKRQRQFTLTSYFSSLGYFSPLDSQVAFTKNEEVSVKWQSNLILNNKNAKIAEGMKKRRNYARLLCVHVWYASHYPLAFSGRLLQYEARRCSLLNCRVCLRALLWIPRLIINYDSLVLRKPLSPFPTTIRRWNLHADTLFTLSNSSTSVKEHSALITRRRRPMHKRQKQRANYKRFWSP